jgi:hypothetical protein
MNRLVFAFAVFVATLCNQMAHAAAPAECLASSGAVFSAHPNASHASYVKKPGGSGRCWDADGFKTQAKADAKPALRSVARAAEKSALRPSITASAPHAHTAAASPAQELHAAAATSPMTAQIAVNAQELRGFLPADEEPADFESRFSAVGYKAKARN